LRLIGRKPKMRTPGFQPGVVFYEAPNANY
jgi:hypothetical protein